VEVGNKGAVSGSLFMVYRPAEQRGYPLFLSISIVRRGWDIFCNVPWRHISGQKLIT
jgi:hypothetical protein